MDLRIYLNKKNILMVFTLIIGIVILFIAFDNLYFRLKNTTPELNKVSDSSVQITYYFSQPLKDVEQISINGTPVQNASIDNKSITIPFNKSLEQGVEYNIELESIKSEWFGNTIKSLKRTIAPQYIDFNKLSEEERNIQINASNSGQVNDPFISNNVFPIFNDRWQIDAKVILDNRTVLLTIQFFAEVPDYDNEGAVTQIDDQTAEKYRTEVIEEIKKRDSSPDRYTIIYTNKYLNEKYNKNPTH